jgi:acyl carrier protein
MSHLSPQEIETSVREIIQRITGLEENEIKPEDHFYQDLGIDSIKGIELAVGLQEKFKIRLDDSKIPELVNVKLVVEELQRLLANNS